MLNELLAEIILALHIH